jgi:hypothetical protein
VRRVLKLIRTLFFAILAAALAPMPAVGQLNQEGAPPPEQSATYKYEVYVGAAYSRIRQVPESYSGLVGGKVSVGRDWGKYFQLAGSGDYYTVGTGHSETRRCTHSWLRQRSTLRSMRI